ncbi:MAG: hypothetical protein ABFE07_28195 [Armatimonadia bacterium]
MTMTKELQAALERLDERFPKYADMSECDAADFKDSAAEIWDVIQAYRNSQSAG